MKKSSFYFAEPVKTKEKNKKIKETNGENKLLFSKWHIVRFGVFDKIHSFTSLKKTW